MEKGTLKVKTGLADMLKGGVIMDVTTVEQAKIAEEAGAVSVMAQMCIRDREYPENRQFSYIWVCHCFKNISA